MENAVQTTPPIVEVKEITPGMLAPLVDQIPEYTGQNIDGLIADAGELVEVGSADARAVAGGYIITLAVAQKEVKAHYEPFTKAANVLHKSITGRRKILLNKIEAETRRLKHAIMAFDREEDRKRQQEQERINRELEAKRQAEQKAREDQAIAEAERLEAEGRGDEAAHVLEVSTQEPSPPRIEASLPDHRPAASISGLAKSTNWGFEVYNLMELVKAIVKGNAPLECVQPNETFLRAMVKAQKEALKYPGVKATKTEGLRAYGG